MKSEKIDIAALVKELAIESNVSEHAIYNIMAESYGKAFGTSVKTSPLQDGRYLLITESGKVLNGLKITHSKIIKISDGVRTKLNSIERKIDIASGFKRLRGATHIVGVVKNSADGNVLFHVPSLAIYTKLPQSEFDILKRPLKADDVVLLSLNNIKINEHSGKTESKFAFKSKKNIYQIISHYMKDPSLIVCDFYDNKVKVRISSKPSRELIADIQQKTNLRIQFSYKKAS